MASQEPTDVTEPIGPAEDTGLVSAFVNETRQAVPGRPGTRILGGVLAVLLVGGIALGIGALTHPSARAHVATPGPSRSPHPSPTRAPASPVPSRHRTTSHPSPSRSHSTPAAVAPSATRTPQVTFTALAGYGCADTATSSFSEAGRYTDGVVGFVRQRRGGWGSEGCDGSFDAMPMSGDATADDPDNYAQWTFRPGGTGTLTCAVSVFTPNDDAVSHVGGHPAIYQVYAADGTSGTAAGSFAVDQTTTRNTWVPAGTFKISTGVLTVKGDSRGIDYTDDASTNAHIAVAQMRVSCTG